jgi:dCMP deaminase
MSLDSREPSDVETYYLNVAIAVRARANCQGTRVGAIIVRDERIVSTGYNGTPQDLTNCDDGGCYRCAHPDDFESGTAYDLCICVHAEQNALIAAARFGNAIENASVFTTSRPCFGCTKELLQARIDSVYYMHDWSHPDRALQAEYETLQAVAPIPRSGLCSGRAGWRSVLVST